MIDLIEKYGDNYLICSGKHPLISSAELSDELVIYNIKGQRLDLLIEHFNTITGKQLTESFPINTLSGGQKTILMVLLAIYSPAPRILFAHLFESLDEANKVVIRDLLDTCAHKEYKIYESDLDH
jgi:ABC-type Mn2+/Zn2+ transport system ATPase subunit